MKRFVVRSVLYLGTVVLVFGTICGVELRWEVNAYREEVKSPQGANILVCGDSQLGMSVDPAVDPAFFNFSAPGRTLDQSCLAMEDVLAANPRRFKSVLIDLSPSASVDTFDQKLPDMGYASQYYLLHWLHLRENGRDLTGQLAVFRDNMVGRRWRLFWRSLRGRETFASSICGSFRPAPEALALVAPDDFRGQLKARAHTVNGAPALTDGAPVFKILDRMISLARANGVEPVLVTTPWHPALRKACDAAKLATFARVVADCARRYGCRHVDLLCEEFSDDCWYDAQHLNAKGAREFTPILKSRCQ